VSRAQHRHEAWAWLKAEIARLIGQDAADQLWAEYARRAHDDKVYNDRVDAPELLDRLLERRRRLLGEAHAAELRRLEKRIARLRALLKQPDAE
jgi:5-methylthioribose kinase